MKRLRNLLIGIWILVIAGVILLVTLLLPQIMASQAVIENGNATSTALAFSLLHIPSLTPAPSPTDTALPPPTVTRASPDPVLEPSPSPEPPPFTLTPQESRGINPLTGLSVSNLSMLDRRPIAVKITNYPRSVRSYQYGLTRADVVYEYYIEDGLSRFIAIFYSKDATTAGPVRSGRYFDEHIARMYHAILVFANADERVEKYLLNSDLLPFLFVSRSDNCPPLCRNTRIQGYNNLFIDTSGVGKFLKYRQTDNSRQSLRASYFSETMVWHPGQIAIDTIFTFYSNYAYNYWEYNPARHVYLRYSDVQDVDPEKNLHEGYAPHIDQLTDEQIITDNVVTLLVPHSFKTEYDRADQVFDIQLYGEGAAYIFRNGTMVEGKWVRDAIDQPIRLMDTYNNPLGLNRGITYYEVLDPESIILQNGKTINFIFFIPPRSLTPTPETKKVAP